MKRIILFLSAAVLIGCGCASRRNECEVEAYFVRGGIAVESPGVEEIKIGKGRVSLIEWSGECNSGVVVCFKDKYLVRIKWKPGETYRVRVGTTRGGAAKEIQAPARPSPMRVGMIDIERIDPHDAEMGTAPDTYVKFSPDAKLLAIGSFKGYIRVVEVNTGSVLMEKRIAEGLVKRIAWGEIRGKKVIYAGEQSPDGFIYCMDPYSGRVVWKYRTADDIESSRQTEASDRYAVYSLPGVFQLKVLPDGDVIAVGAHGWNKDGEYLYRCLVYRFDGATGGVKWKWPEEKPLPFGIVWFSSDARGSKLALVTSSWLDVRETDKKYRDGTVYCLDGEHGAAMWKYTVPPLEPYYRKASAWQAMALSPDGKHAVLGLSDGRGFLFDADAAGGSSQDGIPENRPLWIMNIGTPVIVGGIPVAAHVSYAAVDREVYFVLPGTSVPPGVGSAQKQTPAPHPAAGNIFAYTKAGGLSWKWETPGTTQGIILSEDGRWMAAVTSETFGSDDTEFFGVSLFDLDKPGGGAEKLEYMYDTEGPVFFMADITGDGEFVAAVETPIRLSDRKTVLGGYRVHIIH